MLDFASLNQQDLTALAKELRAVDDVRPPNKVTDYSSSSEESDTTDEDDDEEVDQEAGEESTSGPEDTRAVYVQRFELLSRLQGPVWPCCLWCATRNDIHVEISRHTDGIRVWRLTQEVASESCATWDAPASLKSFFCKLQIQKTMISVYIS